MQDEKNLCAFCNDVAKQKCGACQTVYYCSRDHQKSHWKIHSKICRAYKLVENSQLGRHYVATRNIKTGETVIFDKAPLITALNIIRATEKDNGNISVSQESCPVCLSCYVQLTARNAKPCEKCGWPLCYKCTKHGTECEFTMKHRGSKINISEGEYGRPHPAYEIIGLIRALALREDDPQSYQKLMNLPHFPRVTTQINPEDWFSKAARFAKTFLKITDLQEDDIQKIMRIIGINAHQLPWPRMHITAVYDALSYVEHNCRPNCSKTFTDEDGVIIWAAVPIAKGAHITISYLNTFLGTIQRRKKLATALFFKCECERCKDPTEFGTMFDAIKCRAEKCDGYMLPPTFLVSEGRYQNYPDFVCSKCSARTSWKTVVQANAIISMHWESIDQNNLSECENFYAQWKEVLHKNHFYIIWVEIQLAHLIGFCGSALTERSDESLRNLVKLCKKLTKILKTLDPAKNRMRGMLLYIQSRVHEVLFFRTYPQQHDKQIEFIKGHKQMLNEIYQLLHREPGFCVLDNPEVRFILDEIIKVDSSTRLRCGCFF